MLKPLYNIDLDELDKQREARGLRNMEKALLKALLTPWNLLKDAQDSYDHTRVLALQEELKTLPWGEVWDEYLRRQGMVSDAIMFEEIREYERQTLSKR